MFFCFVIVDEGLLCWMVCDVVVYLLIWLIVIVMWFVFVGVFVFGIFNFSVGMLGGCEVSVIVVWMFVVIVVLVLFVVGMIVFGVCIVVCVVMLVELVVWFIFDDDWLQMGSG